MLPPGTWCPGLVYYTVHVCTMYRLTLGSGNLLPQDEYPIQYMRVQCTGWPREPAAPGRVSYSTSTCVYNVQVDPGNLLPRTSILYSTCVYNVQVDPGNLLPQDEYNPNCRTEESKGGEKCLRSAACLLTAKLILTSPVMLIKPYVRGNTGPMVLCHYSYRYYVRGRTCQTVLCREYISVIEGTAPPYVFQTQLLH